MSRFYADSCDGGAASSAVAMLRQLQESKTKRVGKGLSVMYQDGKFVPTKNKKQTEVSAESQLFQRQILATQADIDANRQFYTECVASALLDELNTEFQREALIDDTFSQEEKKNLNEQFAQERQDFQKYLSQTRKDYDKFEQDKNTQLAVLMDGSTLR